MDSYLIKEYRFSKGRLTSANPEAEYKIRIPNQDRFYGCMKKHIINEGVSGLTELMIDEIIIDDQDKTFPSEGPFTLDAIILATGKDGLTRSYNFTAKGVKLKNTSFSKLSYADGKYTLRFYQLHIPYNTEFKIEELTE